jgi:hypothetical protein
VLRKILTRIEECFLIVYMLSMCPIVKWGVWDDNKRAKVEFAVPLIWHGELSGESASRARRKKKRT